MKEIKFAVIGLGNIGRRHVHHILANPEARLVAVCDTEQEKLEHAETNGAACFTDVDDMLNHMEVDVVNVCTPNFLHHPHTLAALTKRFHVVCEKPMAISSIQCSDMIQAAETAGRTIFVVKQNRYNEPVQQVRKLLEKGLLGATYFIHINCFWNRNPFYYEESAWRGKKETDGGCLFTQFSHFVDILYYLFGEIQDVEGKTFNFNHPYTNVEDTGSFVMKTRQGALVNFNFSTCSYEKNMEGAITILSEHGTVKIGGQYLNTIEYQHIKDHVLPAIAITAKANDYGRYQGSMSNHDRVIDNVINTLRGTEQAMTNAHEGKKVVEMIEQMYTAAAR